MAGWRSHTLAFVVALGCAMHAFAQSPTRAQNAAAFFVIVNAESNVTRLRRTFVAEAFLKRTSRWPNGETIRPVDLAGEPAARRAFSQQVIGRPIDAVRNFWQQVIFSGRGVPPPEVPDDASVVAYVARYTNAIGYVSATPTSTAVRVVVLE